MQTLTAEDGGGHRPQPVSAQVQLLQLFQLGQFAAGGEGQRSEVSQTAATRGGGGGLPGGEGLQLVIGQVQHLEAAVLAQQRDTLVRQAVIGQVDLLEAAAAVL